MNYSVTGEQLTDIADAIRAKTAGSEGLEFPDGFVEAIEGIADLSSLTTNMVYAQKDRTIEVGAQTSVAVTYTVQTPSDIALKSMFNVKMAHPNTKAYISDVSVTESGTNLEVAIVLTNPTDTDVQYEVFGPNNSTGIEITYIAFPSS